MGLSANSATENSDLGIWGISGEMGLIPFKNWTPSLADRCLPHRERGSPSVRLTEVMTHP